MEKLTAKQFGRNVVTVINGTKYSKKTVNNDEVKSISVKLDLYNKKPSAKKLQEIIDLFTPEEKKAKQAKAKGVKKSIKKASKPTSKTKKAVKKEEGEEKIDIIEQVKTEYKAGNIPDEKIRELQELLKKDAEEKERINKEQAEKQEEQKTTNSYQRRGEY